MKRADVTILSVLAAAGLVLGGCASDGHHAASPQGALIPSSHALVIPSEGGRITSHLAGLPTAGSDLGIFAGRRDARIGTRPEGPERVQSGFVRRINDRQYSTLGRPYNSYTNTTRTTVRTDR